MAVQHFLRAIELEPEWAAPHAGLAAAYGMMANWGSLRPEEARALAGPHLSRALELDPTSPEVHMVQGATSFYLDWDWMAADSAFSRGLALGARSTIYRLTYANYLTAMGRFEESLALAEEVLAEDPLHPVAFNEVGYSLRMAGRYQEALARVREGIRLDPGFPQSQSSLMMNYLGLGQMDSALVLAERMAASAPGRADWPGYVFAMAGRRTEAEGILRELTRRAEGGGDGALLARARIHLGLGEEVQALDLLERGFEEHEIDMVWVKVHHWLDPLRSNPRFLDLMARMAFPE
jgi:tetratricopeptide (TPR) repeat protein